MSEAVVLDDLSEQLNPADPKRFANETILPIFERMRAEAPVHYCAESAFGPYWSVTKFDDIVEVEKDPETYSSEPTITVGIPAASRVRATKLTVWWQTGHMGTRMATSALSS